MGQKEVEEALCKEFELLTSVDITSKEENYVFDIVTNSESALAASFSNHTIKILDPETLVSNHSWKAHSKKITDLKFSPGNHCHLLSSSLDGTICLWDIRQPPKKASCCFQDTSSNKPKPIMCFDANCTARYICGGTELIQMDAYIIFWDVRDTKALGGYWDSHTDDITQLKFHPSKKDTLISGSTDGLINLFDVSQITEEDALISTLNTESSVSKLNWIPDSETKLSCITHTHDLKVWNAFEPSPYISITHGDFKNKADIKAPVDYLVDILKFTPSKIQLMSGSFNGSSCIWDIKEDHFNVRDVLAKGHTDVVRTCRWNEKMKAVITGGEDGVVSIWKETEEQNPASESTAEISLSSETIVEANIASESTIEEPNITCECKREKIEDTTLSSESKTSSSAVMKRESRKFRPY